jgi:hypothetical protein
MVPTETPTSAAIARTESALRRFLRERIFRFVASAIRQLRFVYNDEGNALRATLEQGVMREAIEKEILKRVYNQVANHYDFQHAFFTGRSDQRGRRLVVDKAVRSGDRVLYCGAGTGSAALRRPGSPGLPEGSCFLT